MADEKIDTFRVHVANLPPRTFNNRRQALLHFAQACVWGVWCDVWEIYGENSGVKIADFPGLPATDNLTNESK